MTLLNYGYGNCRLYKDETPPELPKLSVTGGKEPEVELSYGETFTYLGLHGEDFSGVERELMLEEKMCIRDRTTTVSVRCSTPRAWNRRRRSRILCSSK